MDKCIQNLFEEQVTKTPDAVAVVCEDQQLTYTELNSRANQLAHYLQAAGLGPEKLVGICTERSLEMVVGVLGILKAGAAYVPLDPDYPRERLSFMLEDAHASALVTQRRLARQLPNHDAKIVCVDADRHEIAKHGDQNLAGIVAPDNLAYVIYTSGSTGKPKGVAIEHRSVMTLLSWAQSVFTDEDLVGVLASTSICFDLSVFELFAPLTRGGQAILARNALCVPLLSASARLSLINTVPSAIAQLLETGGIPRSVHCINLAGEPLRATLVRDLYERTSVSKVYDLYGPSEDTTYSTFALRSPTGPQTIGKPISDTQVYVLDQELKPVPIGTAGELHIGGNGLARGYLNRPELTGERFIPNPFSNHHGSRLYKTGDLARYLPDGNLEFLGRADHQIKIRGFRVELGEIECALTCLPGIREAVVLAREGNLDNKQLVAYVVPRNGHTVRTSALRNSLKEKLPEYMVPSAFVFLDKLPLTANSKIDRKALPPPDHNRPDFLTAVFVAPRTGLESVIADIWAEVLGLWQVGVNDDFFELGGHSLRATQIVSRVRDAFHVELPLACLFANASVATLAEIIAHAKANETPVLRLDRARRDLDLPLSYSQERIWFIQQLDPGNLAYNFQATLRFTGPLDVVALEQSLSELVRRHEIFRTTFPGVNGRPVQFIHPPKPVDLPLLDFRSLPEADRETRAQQWIRDELRRPFDLTQLPLVRWHLLRLSTQDYILLQVEHHLVHDGWSFTIFLRELLEIYKAFAGGKPSPLPELAIQFADFACWQRQWLQGSVVERQLEYWKRQLAGCPPILALPTDCPRPAVQTFCGAAPRAELPLRLVESLRILSRREGVTLFMTLLAGFVALLHRYTGQNDICVGSGIANRRWCDTEGLIGMIINNVVLRTDASGNPPFRDLLRQVREVTLAAAAHQDLPFDHVVQALAPERDPSFNPLFQTMFSFHDAPKPDLVLPGLRISLTEALSNESAKFDLNVIVIPRLDRRFGRTAEAEDDGLTVIWEYNTDLFDSATMTRMMRHYQTTLEGIIVDPAQRLSDLPLLTESERRQQLVEWNNTRTEYPTHKCIHELFEAQVEKIPGAVAVVFEDRRLTYRELNNRANQLAHYLRKLGVGPGVFVGICLDRSPEMIVALLGVLKAGGAYVPLDSSYPEARLEYMLKDSGVAVLLTFQELSRRLPEYAGRTICLDQERQVIGSESTANLPNEATENDISYVMYTSGSTGNPKGIMIPHKAISNHMMWMLEAFPLDRNDRVAQRAPFSFDASVWELFAPLLAGGQLILARPEGNRDAEYLVKFVQKEQISILQVVPTLLQMLLDENLAQCSSLRRVFCGGEPLSTQLYTRFRRQLAVPLINLYGPTEAAIDATYYACSEDDFSDWMPIGRPIANTQIYILDQQGQPVPIGVEGELYIGGLGLAQGYVNQPELNAEKFIANPFNTEPGAKLYKTGDLARYLPDGNIQFLGRVDNQIKIRGIRIELEEIEAVLNQHPKVREAIVIVREDRPGDKRLVAYLVEDENQELSADEFKRFLKTKLPDYMVPSAWMNLASLPTTPNGKINRAALPAPVADRLAAVEGFTAPRTQLEKTIARIWAEVLKVEKAGIHDNFFDLGGHSLIATQVISRMRKVFALEIPLRALFDSPTIEQMAAAIMERQGEPLTADEITCVLDRLEPLSEDGAKRHLVEKSRLNNQGQRDG
jgi:surfactin family lipopeptide synthetase A